MKVFDVMMPQPELGKCAKELRKSKGVPLFEFADMLGVSKQTIINFENGKTQSMAVLLGYMRLKDYGNDNTATSE